jgi:tetratricopeptide (TPR) repeat protein
MKYLIIFLSLIAINLKAQTDLKFDKRFVESEDKWVAFQMDKDSTYSFGFIYIDAQAGLTLNSEGKFKISTSGKYIPEKLDSISLKVRLLPNSVKVAFIPKTKFEELKISTIPEWLKYYKTDTLSIERLYRWGFLYNSWDECTKALTYLEKAQTINPKFNGLEFELAYAYNALQQYDKAITVLKSAIETTPNDCYLYKELSFAEMHIGQLDKASETCKKGIPLCTDKAMKCELAYNLAYQYYKIKDKKNFKTWADLTRKYSSKGDQFSTNIDKMENNPDN